MRRPERAPAPTSSQKSKALSNPEPQGAHIFGRAFEPTPALPGTAKGELLARQPLPSRWTLLASKNRSLRRHWRPTTPCGALVPPNSAGTGGKFCRRRIRVVLCGHILAKSRLQRKSAPAWPRSSPTWPNSSRTLPTRAKLCKHGTHMMVEAAPRWSNLRNMCAQMQAPGQSWPGADRVWGKSDRSWPGIRHSKRGMNQPCSTNSAYKELPKVSPKS